MTIRFLKAAQTEFDEAVDWYKTVSPELGDAFVVEAIRVLRLIETYPQAWHPMAENYPQMQADAFSLWDHLH